MARNGETNKAKKKGSPKTVSHAKDDRELIEDLIDQAASKLGTRVTVSEFLKLLEMRRQLEMQEVKEVEVRWVDESPKPDAIRP